VHADNEECANQHEDDCQQRQPGSQGKPDADAQKHVDELFRPSLMAARNRTIDKAPTNPNDKAREDFTTEITPIVTRVNSGKTRVIESLSEADDPQLR
jgi:hypothetical protein